MKPQNTPSEEILVVVDPVGLAGLEQSKPNLPFARELIERIQAGGRKQLALVAMLGAAAHVIKKNGGFEERGGDRRSKPQDAVLKSKWADYCRKEFRASDDSIDRAIKVFLIAVDRAEALEGGKQSPECQLLTTPPSVIESPDFEIDGHKIDGFQALQDVLERLLPEKNQNELLRKISPADSPKPSHTLSAADRKKAAAATAKKLQERNSIEASPEVATVFFLDTLTTFEGLAKETLRCRESDNLAALIWTEGLPLLSPEPFEEGTVMGLKNFRDRLQQFQEAIAEDMAAFLKKLNHAIDSKESKDSKMIGAPPKRARKATNKQRK